MDMVLTLSLVIWMAERARQQWAPEHASEQYGDLEIENDCCMRQQITLM